MKKIFALALSVVCMLAVFVACGNSVDTKAVEEKLNNTTWVTSGQDYATGQDFTTSWNFTDGKATAKNTLGSEEFPADNATYRVSNNGVIALTWEQENNNRITEIYYVFENDELKLYMDKEKQAALTRQ